MIKIKITGTNVPVSQKSLKISEQNFPNLSSCQFSIIQTFNDSNIPLDSEVMGHLVTTPLTFLIIVLYVTVQEIYVWKFNWWLNVYRNDN